METIFDGKNIKADFEAQVTAALINALIPTKLSRRRKFIREAFYLNDLHEWIKNPHMYQQSH